MLSIYYISDSMSIFDELITKSEMSKDEVETKIKEFQKNILILIKRLQVFCC